MTRTGSLLAAGVLVVVALGVSAPASGAAQIVSVNQNAMGQPLMQTGQLLQDMVPSQCNPTSFKLVPTLGDTSSSFSYVNHTFRSSLTQPVCITVDISTACGSLFSVAYLPTFTPSDPVANYAADMGQSSGSPVYSFNVAGGSFFAVVIHETTTSPSCGAYTLTVSSRGPWADSPPSIGGAPSVGSVLTGNDAAWVAGPAVGRRWVRCDPAGADCADIPGATAASYTVTGEDLGHTLRFRNAATDVEATNMSESAYVEPFIPFNSRAAESLAVGDRVQSGFFVRNSVETRCAAPTSPPAILMPAQNFLYDTFAVSSLLNEPVCLVARTLPACGSGVTPAIYNPVFAPAAGLAANYVGNSGRGFNLEGAVSAILPAAESREVAVSIGGMGGACASYSVTLGADAPFATARPAVSGDPAQPAPLTASDGTWSGTPALGRSWLRCDGAGGACADIPDETGASYTPTRADIGSRVRVRVTATQGRSVSSDSEPSAVVPDRFPPIGGLRLGSRNLARALKSRRVPVRVNCDEACSAAVELRVSRRTARRLRLRTLVIARATGALIAGQTTTLRPRLTRAARRALRRRMAVRFRAVATLRDAAGNTSQPGLNATLRRPRGARPSSAR